MEPGPPSAKRPKLSSPALSVSASDGTGQSRGPGPRPAFSPFSPLFLPSPARIPPFFLLPRACPRPFHASLPSSPDPIPFTAQEAVRVFLPFCFFRKRSSSLHCAFGQSLTRFSPFLVFYTVAMAELLAKPAALNSCCRKLKLHRSIIFSTLYC